MHVHRCRGRSVHGKRNRRAGSYSSRHFDTELLSNWIHGQVGNIQSWTVPARPYHRCDDRRRGHFDRVLLSLVSITQWHAVVSLARLGLLMLLCSGFSSWKTAVGSHAPVDICGRYSPTFTTYLYSITATAATGTVQATPTAAATTPSTTPRGPTPGILLGDRATTSFNRPSAIPRLFRRQATPGDLKLETLFFTSDNVETSVAASFTPVYWPIVVLWQETDMPVLSALNAQRTSEIRSSFPESSPPSLTDPAKIGIGIGAAIGGLLILTVVAMLVLRNRRRRRQYQTEKAKLDMIIGDPDRRKRSLRFSFLDLMRKKPAELEGDRPRVAELPGTTYKPPQYERYELGSGSIRAEEDITDMGAKESMVKMEKGIYPPPWASTPIESISTERVVAGAQGAS